MISYEGFPEPSRATIHITLYSQDFCVMFLWNGNDELLSESLFLFYLKKLAFLKIWSKMVDGQELQTEHPALGLQFFFEREEREVEILTVT